MTDFNRNHILLFIELVANQPDIASLFAPYFLFRREDGSYGRPCDVYLDVPFLETGLSAYFNLIDTPGRRRALAHDYLDSGIDRERFVNFARAVEVQTELAVKSTKCELNPAWQQLHSGDVRKPGNDSWKRINSDFDVLEFGHLAAAESLAASRLIWSTMINVVMREHLNARYNRNNESKEKIAPSRLVHRLISACWVPQADKGFVCPADVVREQLPAGFPFDPGWHWVLEAGFGANAARESAEQAVGEIPGLDAESLDLAREIAVLPPEARSQIRALARQMAIELPNCWSLDPKHRAKKVREEAQTALGRITAKVIRSVQVGLDGVKEEAKQYLRDMYTNADGDMICQLCKAPLPFKLDDGNYYFEAVQFLPELERRRRHSQNYLAICPNHGAMFQYANGSKEHLLDAFTEMPGNHLAIILAQKEVTSYFTTKHRDDLKVVIQAERDQNPADR